MTMASGQAWKLTLQKSNGTGKGQVTRNKIIKEQLLQTDYEYCQCCSAAFLFTNKYLIYYWSSDTPVATHGDHALLEDSVMTILIACVVTLYFTNYPHGLCAKCHPRATFLLLGS